jgi:DNA-binding HxlR family transcriptional regulator
MNTYERKTPEDLNCGLTVFMKVLGAKWKPCIIDAIHQGYKRPSEIHKALQPATPRVIDMQLSELEQFGLVSKQIYPGFPLHVDYSLTQMGLSILPIITQMDKWGNVNAYQVKQVNDLRQANSSNTPIRNADSVSCSLTHTE